jgi:hypothetical protein
MAENHRTPRAEHIDVTVAVDIVQIRSLGACNKQRAPANRTKGANRRVNPAWKKSFCTKLQLSRMRKYTGHEISIGERRLSLPSSDNTIHEKPEKNFSKTFASTLIRLLSN